MKFIAISAVTIFLSISGCIESTGLIYPEKDAVVVLNGILAPDKILKVNLSLSYSLNVDPDATLFISDAEVLFFENDIQLLPPKYFNDGVYALNYYPKPGSTYRVEAHVPNYGMVSATDSVPRPVSIDGCFKKREGDSFSPYTAEIALRIQDNPGATFFWIDVMAIDSQDSTKLLYINSSTPYLDNFNVTFDNTFGLNEYTLFLHLDDQSFQDQCTVRIEGGEGHPYFNYEKLLNLTDDQALLVNVYSSSYHYDKYLKSTVLDFLLNDFYADPVPFSSQTKIYSNVVNGLGIFAGSTRSTIHIEDQLCQ